MSRPWIEFIQSQRLPWQDDALPRLRPGAALRCLSRDARAGACSVLLRYPPGFATAPIALDCDEELFVIDGTLQVGAQTLGPYGYAHLPAGHDAGPCGSEQGAIVLTFFATEPLASSQPRSPDPRRLVPALDALALPYTGDFHPQFPPGAGRRLLYRDPVTRDTTWLLGTLPLRRAERSEVHPTVEEMYLLAGEVHGDRGVMRPGAYFWRPPGVAHGPYGTQTGNLYFFRTRGGGLSTTYVDAARPFQWRPPYAVVLPAEYEGARGEVESGAARW